VSGGFQAHATRCNGFNALQQSAADGMAGDAGTRRARQHKRLRCVLVAATSARPTCLKALGVYYNNSWRRIALSRRYDKIDPTVGVNQLSVASTPACKTP